MTNRTRRRLTFCLVLCLMTLPAEALLFPVALTPDQRVAADHWAASLSPAALRSAGRRIEDYPAVYRRAIVTALDPAGRSAVWRSEFDGYLAGHPHLSPAQIAVVREAMDVASPEAFTPPVRPEIKAHISAVFNRAMTLLGKQDAAELFVTLGPTSLQHPSALPLTQRIADAVRSWRTVHADGYPDCNCNVEIDTCDLVPDPWLQCSELYTCNFILSWPMCGPLWSWACTGWCKIIRWPAGSY